MSGSGRPSRTLSWESVLRPMSTASPNDRSRRRWRLSSREVKSTGENARVVIFPSTVMAKVAATKGRLFGLASRLRFARRGRPIGASLLFVFGDLMLQRGDLFSHLAQLNVTSLSARLV